MSLSSKLSTLRDALSPDSEILTDATADGFRERLQRWTDIDLKTPAAIVLPTSEEDIQKIVQWAVSSSIPFVTKSGGHSEWSTIGGHGIIIDLSKYSGVEVDTKTQTATLIGSILSKDVAVSLAEAGMCTALGNGNAIGAIPYFLGGGIPITVSDTGFGSDQILSARMITAKGDLIDVIKDTYADLLYALRGAGQFFGLVTQLVIKTHPLSVLGNDRGVIWAGSFVFPLDRAEEVCQAIKYVIDDSRYGTSGLMMVMAPPPKRQPSLVVAARLTGDPADAQEAYKPLYDLNPLVTNGAEVLIQNTSDGRAANEAKGDFKRFGIAGLKHFDAAAFMEVVSLSKRMITEIPDAINTTFSFQWDARPVRKPDFESAISLHEIRYWQNNLIWYTDPKNHSKMDAFNKKVIATMRGPDEKDLVDYQNATRDGPIEYRYRGTERLAHLKKLKREWDPTGVFTDQLL